MRFSVLMSVYVKENPSFFKESLKSVLNQTVPPSEIVIVKDGKLTSQLDSIIEEFLKLNPKIFKVVELKYNQGLGEALKKGVQECSYDIIARMDTDDIAINTRFQKQLAILKKYDDIDIVGSYIKEFENNVEDETSIRRVPLTNLEIKAFAKQRNPFNHMTVMFRKEAVLKVGNYQPFLWNEDYYLWVRMIVNESKMSNIPECLVYARTGKEMYARRGGIRYVMQEIRLQKEFKNLGFINLYTFIKNIVIRVPIRLIPNKFREWIYLKTLREN